MDTRTNTRTSPRRHETMPTSESLLVIESIEERDNGMGEGRGPCTCIYIYRGRFGRVQCHTRTHRKDEMELSPQQQINDEGETASCNTRSLQSGGKNRRKVKDIDISSQEDVGSCDVGVPEGGTTQLPVPISRHSSYLGHDLYIDSHNALLTETISRALYDITYITLGIK